MAMRHHDTPRSATPTSPVAWMNRFIFFGHLPVCLCTTASSVLTLPEPVWEPHLVCSLKICCIAAIPTDPFTTIRFLSTKTILITFCEQRITFMSFTFKRQMSTSCCRNWELWSQRTQVSDNQVYSRYCYNNWCRFGHPIFFSIFMVVILHELVVKQCETF